MYDIWNHCKRVQNGLEDWKYSSNFQKGTVLSLGVVGKIDANCRQDLEAI